ncbi:Uncharacterised protein [Mycobacterium tuberculosis]|nr:Uncharacterised protein [Mycobacterium tuberculosis]
MQHRKFNITRTSPRKMRNLVPRRCRRSNFAVRSSRLIWLAINAKCTSVTS